MIIKEESFDQILKNNELYRHFESYLASELCTEALYFYKEMTEFANESYEDKEDLKERVSELLDKYFNPDSEYYVYVPEYLTEEIVMQQGQPHKAIFDDARNDIECLLRTKFYVFCKAINEGKFLLT